MPDTQDSFSSAVSSASSARACDTGSSSQKTHRRHRDGRSSRLSSVTFASRRDNWHLCYELLLGILQCAGSPGPTRTGNVALRPDSVIVLGLGGSPGLSAIGPVPAATEGLVVTGAVTARELPGTRYARAPRYPLPVMTGGKSFGSDNHTGAHPEVIQAIAAANAGDAHPYGADDWTARAAEHLRNIFGAAGAFFVFNGTAANVLGISLLLRPFDSVICAESSHLNVDECGATERNLGNKVVPVATPDGKLTPELIRSRLTGRGDEHRSQPRVVEIAQVTEVGTCYSLSDLRLLAQFCRAEGLCLYMDGARLANAAANLGCELADLAAHADVLSFGGTKNGAVAAEAVIVMRDDLLADVPFL